MALQHFPGFIDAHVHLRDPGATHKEDFQTGSRAAIAGGFTYILDMPNNPIPTVSVARLQEKIKRAKKARCDIGFHFGTDGKNMQTFSTVWGNPLVFGLKIYCNHTTGTLLVEDKAVLEKICTSWKSDKPILVHAEGKTLELMLSLAKTHKKRLHVCHISLKTEIKMVKKAKTNGSLVTAGVTPHHLFLTSGQIMKPPLGTKKDQDALWAAVEDGTIDIIETDHAPHTIAEKKSEKPPFGVPGLETCVGLMFLAVKKKKLAQKKVIDLLYTQPKNIFHIPDQPKTSIALDPDKPYIVGIGGYESKCGWSPFDGWELYGQIEEVMLRGKYVVRHNKII